MTETTYLLVPGACHGGWCFDELAGSLRGLGHRVLATTLTGLSERAHLAGSTVNLETHLRDVLALLEVERLERVVLVGHSYGGMVISGVADRVPERVAGLVYLDAFVPADGDSCWRLTDDTQRAWYAAVDPTGYGVPPLPFFDPRATAHPLASLLQPIRLTGAVDRVRDRTYVYATRWDGGSPFEPTYRRLRDDPGWRVHALDARHNLMRDAPGPLLEIVAAAG
jgi:pimeloyl-ACP methyl ester carboxylesterase